MSGDDLSGSIIQETGPDVNRDLLFGVFGCIMEPVFLPGNRRFFIPEAELARNGVQTPTSADKQTAKEKLSICQRKIS